MNVLQLNRVVILGPDSRDSRQFDNDVALIELQADVAFTPLIAPVCLAAAEDAEGATKAVATGWGDTSFGETGTASSRSDD